jgi:sialic acid synthase SpsE
MNFFEFSVKNGHDPKKTADRAKNVFIIAELGTGHGGDLKKARELTAAAADAGADCVKFQIVYADEILHPNTGLVDLPGGKIRLYDRFKQLRMPPSFFEEIKSCAESKGLVFLCTPFGPKSARELRDLRPKMVKIASPELNYGDLLREIAAWGIPTLLSSGVSKLGDIEEALETLETHWKKAAETGGYPESSEKSRDFRSQVCLLHCVTAYPAPETEYNLKLLPYLAGIFGVSVGISDHSTDPELVPALGTAMGAAVIEKHFCLSRDDPGLDDPIALPPPLFARMVGAVRKASRAGPAETLAAYSRERGAGLIETILGTGIKSLASSEQANYGRTNRSLHAMRDIQAGEIIKKEDIGILRTEKILRPGLPPSWAKAVTGKRACLFIPSGEGIRLEDIGG